MAHVSTPPLRVLHSVRVLGFADTDVVAERALVRDADAIEALRQAEANGWVEHVDYFGIAGWTLTDPGKAENERQLAQERVVADPGAVVAAVYREFLPLNARLVRACSDWQLRPTAQDSLAPNDHTDPHWDERVLNELAALADAVAPLVDRLSDVLLRFSGYHARFDAALRSVRAGQHEWVDKTDVDSCHRVWFQLHEDLVATLGIDRRTEGERVAR